MKWNIQFTAYLSCAFLVQVVFPKTVKQVDESIPYIAIGEHHLEETQCLEGISLFMGDNATLFCNTSVTLVCDADGEPIPKISWLLNGKRLGKSSENLGFVIQNTSLVLRNASVQTGRYTCVASNANGMTNASTIINYLDPERPEIFSDLKIEVFTDNFKVQFITVGSNVTAYGNSLLILICNVSGSPRPLIEWNKENGIIDRKFLQGDNLILPHNVGLSGKYWCKARNSAGQTQLASYVRFIEPVLPIILSSKKKLTAIDGENHVALKAGDDVTAIAGTEVTIQCLASGVPDPKVTWYYNGQVCPEKHLSSYGYGISFHNKAILSSASGNYTCVASNAFGSVSVTSSLHVIEPVMPYINSSSEDIVSYDMSYPTGKQIGGSIKSLVGASFWLECNVGGIPRPKVTWEKDNMRIYSSKRIKVLEKKVEVLGTMMSDTGWYSCIASNGAGTVRRSTFIHLVAPEKPRIRRSSYRRSYLVNNMPTPLQVSVGFNLRILAYRKLTIYCSATGFPTPHLSWEKNGEPIGTDESIVVSNGGGKLIFKKLLPAQNGVYTCVASNAAGHDRRRTRVISRMPFRPTIELRKSVLSKTQPSPQLGSIRVYEIPDGQTHLVVGSDIILECIAKQGYPRAKFKWFKDGRRIKKKTTESFNRSKLKLLNVQKVDEGVYKCLASNMLGPHEKIIEIKLKDRNRYIISQQNRQPQAQK
mgnify:FL=1